MKKAYPILATVALGLGVLWYVAAGKASSTSASTTPLSAGQTTAASNKPYADGSYTGDAVDVGYGTVQIKATISGGKITDVKFLQLPNDRERSVEVSNYSSPLLRTEALQAQSANVDIVSGATSTSEGFQQSLQSALTQSQS